MTDQEKTKLHIKSEATESLNVVSIKTYEDGSLTFSADGAEHFIYLYPSQVKELEALLLLRRSAQ